MNTIGLQGIPSKVSLSKLDQVDGLMKVADGFIRESRQLRPIGEAQRIIRECGYVLHACDMIEGDFYQLTYIAGERYGETEDWPFSIKLRFISNGATCPPLILTYRSESDGRFYRYSGFLQQFDCSTDDPEARRHRQEFKRDHPEENPVWMPLFDFDPCIGRHIP